jgi:Tfp pilus assembly protein PilX
MIRRLRSRLAGESGFTLVVVMGTMLVLTLLTVAALASVQGDLGPSHKDAARKQAYAAAEAGVADYLFHLQQDPNYWANCTGVPAPSAVNNAWNGSGTDTRTNWRTVPGTTSQYAIELIPRSPYTQCTTGTNVAASMIDPSTRTMQIRVTGKYQNAKRSIVASLGIGGFLDFLYFTDLETSDPVWYDLTTKGRPTMGTDSKSLMDWAAQDGTQASGDGCAQWWRAGRSASGNTWSGTYTDSGGGSLSNVSCTKIQFATGDVLAGPVHTNDDLYTCNATFGSEDTDAIESGESWRSACFGANPTFKGTWKPNSPTLTMPTTDATLSSVVDSGYSFTGKTTIVLGTSNIQITNNGSTVTKAYPPSGVIYVANGTCGQSYKVLDPYGDTNAIPTGCADVYVSGSYTNQELTIASQKDIIVNGDITRTTGGDGLLGLIADNFVRVYHKINRDATDPTDCTNASYTIVHRIDSAILALSHSFTVDNYYCGAQLGTLTINGAIAQKFRGPVGTTGSGGSGYLKDYDYDKRFQYRVPPHFLSPLETSWRVKRYTEQADAR